MFSPIDQISEIEIQNWIFPGVIWRCAYGEELGRVGKPGFDDGGCMEDDVATGEGGEERGIVGDIAVDDF